MHHVVPHHRSCDIVDSLPCDSRQEFVCCPVWLRSIRLLSRRQPSDLHPLLHRADTEAKKKTPRVAAPVLKELPRQAFCPLTVPRRWVGDTRCVVSRPSNLSWIRAQHKALGGHALHPLSWCSCPSASSFVSAKWRETDTSSHIKQAMCPRSKWHCRFQRATSPDRGTLRLGVRDALVGFPLRLKM